MTKPSSTPHGTQPSHSGKPISSNHENGRSATEQKPPSKLLVAWTPVTYKPPYPPYVNVTQIGSMVQITVRGETKTDGAVGDIAVMTVNNWTWVQICDAIADGQWQFDCSLEPPLAGGLAV